MIHDDLANHEIAAAYLRGLWRRVLAKVLCHYGHHDYETHAVGEDHAVLECFYCGRLKKSYLSNHPYDTDYMSNNPYDQGAK